MSACIRRTIVFLSVALLTPLESFAQQGWTGTIAAVSAPEPDWSLRGPAARVAVDPAGNAIAVWARLGRVEAARAPAATLAWSAPVDLGAGDSPEVVVDEASNAMVVWRDQSRATAARYVAATDQWSAAVVIGEGVAFDLPPVVVGSAQDVAVFWVASDALCCFLYSARFAASAAAWQPAALIATGSSIDWPSVAADGAGNITVLFDGPHNAAVQRVSAVRYAAATASWGPVVPVSATASEARHGPIAVDAGGNVSAVWWRWAGGETMILEAARFVAAAGVWTAPTALATSGRVSDMRLGSDAAGNAVVLWNTGFSAEPGVRTARYSAGDDVWTAGGVLPLSTAWTLPQYLTVDSMGVATFLSDEPDGMHLYRTAVADPQWAPPTIVKVGGPAWGLAADAQGNVLAYGFRFYSCEPTHNLSPICGEVWAVRWSASTGSWGERIWVAPGTYPAVGFSPAGNAVAVWTNWRFKCAFAECPAHIVRGEFQVEASHWLGSPAAPQIDAVTPLDGGLSVAFGAPVTTEAQFAPTTYEYSVDDGATWRARAPPSIETPLAIGGLTPGVRRAVRLRAVNTAGAGVASAAVSNTPGPIPEPPTDVAATTIAGLRVTLAWTPPAYGVAPTGYVVEGGVIPGAVSASIRLDAAQAGFTFDAPAPTFYVRVHSVADANRSPASGEIRVDVATPGPPTDLAGSVVGNQVTLAWSAPINSLAPTSYLIEAGVATGETQATLATADNGTSYSLHAPDGVFFVRVRGVAGTAVGPASNEIRLAVNRPVPSAPEALLGLVNGSTVALSWMNGAGGGLAATMLLTVTGSIATTLVLPVGEAFSIGGVPPGTYTFTVAALNASGPSLPSNAVTLSMPGPCSGAPQLPEGVTATVAGGVIDLSWRAPSAGPAVAGYEIRVTGGYTGVIPTTGRRLTATVAPGSYSVSLAAANVCGTSAPTAPMTITVSP